ncbi:MAG: hypothetical protein PHS14_12965 [Elusimicrobia bacterium]|nr:hypothetical protein [Elusimicrobiota bacterium]
MPTKLRRFLEASVFAILVALAILGPPPWGWSPPHPRLPPSDLMIRNADGGSCGDEMLLTELRMSYYSTVQKLSEEIRETRDENKRLRFLIEKLKREQGAATNTVKVVKP